jgi:hypothetical protein
VRVCGEFPAGWTQVAGTCRLFSYSLQKTHAHVVGVMIDDESAIAKAMTVGDIHWGPDVRRHIYVLREVAVV